MSDLVVGDIGAVTISTPAGKDVEDLVDETRAHLFSGKVDEFNVLSGSHDPSQITFTFVNALGGMAAGSLLAVDLEVVFIRSVSGSTATVIRGWLGSTGVTHAANSIVWVNPTHSNFGILRAINQELRSLSAAGLYRVKTKSITSDASFKGYDLETDLISIIKVDLEGSSSDRRWKDLDNWRVEHDLPAASFASTKAIFINYNLPDEKVIRIRYRADFSELSAYADDVLAVSGLPVTAHDIPPLGAAAKLLAVREAKRSYVESQGDPRRSEEVAPGSSIRSAQALLTLKNSRVSEEIERLRARFPIRIR